LNKIFGLKVEEKKNLKIATTKCAEPRLIGLTTNVGVTGYALFSGKRTISLRSYGIRIFNVNHEIKQYFFGGARANED